MLKDFIEALKNIEKQKKIQENGPVIVSPSMKNRVYCNDCDCQVLPDDKRNCNYCGIRNG